MKQYCQTELWRMLIARLNYWLNSGKYTNVMTKRMLPVDYVFMSMFLNQMKLPEWSFLWFSFPITPKPTFCFLCRKLRCRNSQELITWAKVPYFAFCSPPSLSGFHFWHHHILEFAILCRQSQISILPTATDCQLNVCRFSTTPSVCWLNQLIHYII